MRTQNSQKHTRCAKSVTIELPIKNNFPIFSDFLDEIQRQFDTEKNIKNHLYNFIISKGLINDLKAYQSSHDMTDPNVCYLAITALTINLPESKN